MKTYADLEIALHRRDANSYAIELRFNPPEGEVLLIQRGTAHFDLAGLRKLALDDSDYAESLTKSLFKDRAVVTAFSQAHSPTPCSPWPGAFNPPSAVVGPRFSPIDF